MRFLTTTFYFLILSLELSCARSTVFADSMSEDKDPAVIKMKRKIASESPLSEDCSEIFKSLLKDHSKKVIKN